MKSVFFVRLLILSVPLLGLLFYFYMGHSAPLKEASYDSLDYESRGALAFFKDPQTGKGFTGIAKQVNKKSGTVTAEFPMKDGLFHGNVKEWYVDGKAKSETEFSQGTRHGKNIEWTAEGKIYNQRVYDHDKIVKEKKGE